MGKLYGIGVGPGDPELLTLKAYKILNQADVIFCPEKKNRYLAVFTGWNLVFLAGLWVLHLCL